MFPAVPASRYIFGSIPWYSVLIIAGIILALALCSREEKRLGLPEDTVIDLALCVIPSGIVGARIYYVVFSWEMFSSDLLSVFRIWEGGLAIYGGIIGGLIAVTVFSLIKKTNPFQLTDMIVPGLAVAQAIGRWGNYFNMEAYGRQITNPLWQFFPVAVQIPNETGYAWHMATFFYESVWNLLVFSILWFCIRSRAARVGTTTLWYLLLYGLGRFLIEGLRTDSLMSGDLRISQALSIVLAALACIILLIRRMTAKSSTNEVTH